MAITNTKVVDSTEKYIVQAKGIGSEEDQIMVDAENLASGVYFIATQIGNDINNQKVMLIK